MIGAFSISGLRTQIPLLKSKTYADTAATGLLYDPLLEWRRQYDIAYFEEGGLLEMNRNRLIAETRETIGQFFGCNHNLVALTPNFSIGLNFLIEGLDPGMQVLLLEGDYPSVNWPFESRGFHCTRIACDELLEERIEEQLASGDFDVLALSLIQWVNGIKIASGFLEKIKNEHPNLLIIADATQFCGAFPLDFHTSGIDVLGASGYKWLLAGFGNAFFLFKEGVQRHFKLKATGFNASGGNTERQFELRFPRQLEPGHLDKLNFGSLKYSLDMLAGIGMDQIEAHNALLGSQLREGLLEMGLLERAVTLRAEHGMIYNIRGDDLLHGYLREQGIICSQRGGGIRLSLHLYNTPEEVSAIIELLHSY